MKKNWFFILFGLLAFFLLFAAYSNHFDNSFHFDDSHVIVNNLYIRSLHNVPEFFLDARTSSSLIQNATYRPVVTASLAFDYFLGGGMNVRQFHITQFALLVVLGVMLFFCFLHLMTLTTKNRWNRYAALFAAILFCIHTVNTETLNMISARSELLSTIGILGSLLVYFHLPSWHRFHVYLLPMALGTLAKPPAVMFAPLLFVYALLFEKLSFRRAVRSTLPAFLVGLSLFWFVEGMNPPGQTYGGGNRFDYLMTQSFVWIHYLRLFFFPMGLTADTDWTLLPHWYDTRFFAGVVVILLLLCFLWKWSKRPEMRPAAFGMAWFLLALLPASSIFPLAEVTNEHRVFFPYIGLTLAVVWWAAHEVHRRSGAMVPVASTLACLVLYGHGLGTFERNKVWKTEETLWFDVTQKSPTNGRALMNYGLTQMAAGKLERARDYFEKAFVFTPNYAHLETNLGIVYSALADFPKGEKHFQRALQLNPNFASGHHFYGVWLEKNGRRDDAISHLSKAIELSPGEALPRRLLMKLYSDQGKEDELRLLVEQTLAISPNDPAASSYLQAPLLK